MSIKNSKKDFLKLLAKTSVVAMTALSAGSAFGENITIDTGAADLALGTNMNRGGVGAAPAQAGDTLEMVSAQDITFNANVALGGLDLAGKDMAGKNINVAEAANGGSIGAIGNAGPNKVALQLADGAADYTFKLTGLAAAANVDADDYSGLGDITIGEKATLEIDAAGETTFAGAIDGGGTLNTNDQEITFNGAIGGTTALADIATDVGDVTFNAAVNATKITTNQGAVRFNGNVIGDVNLHHDNSVINVGNGVTITGDVDNTTGADGKGVVNFAGAGEVTAAMGGSNILASINLQGAGEVVFGGAVSTNEITLAANSIMQINADVTSTNGIKGTGSIKVNANNKSITGLIGKGGGDANTLESVIFAGDHTLTINSTGDHYVKVFKGAANNHGSLAFAADNITINGDIGYHKDDGDADNRYLNAVNITDKTITLNGSAYTANGIKLNDNATKLVIDGQDRVINKIVSGGNQGKIELAANATVTFGEIGDPGNGVERLTLAAGVDPNNPTHAIINGDAYFDGTNGAPGAQYGLLFNENTQITVAKDKKLNFANGSTIDATDNNRGTLILNGQTIDTTIGAIKRLAEVRAASGDVVLSGDTNVENLTIADGATMKISEAKLDATAIAPYMPGDKSTATLILDGDTADYDHIVGTGGVGEISEIQFTGVDNHSLTVTNAAGAAVFKPVLVSSEAGGTRTININSAGNMDIPTNFSTIDGDQLTKLHINSTNNADHTFSLTGDVINVANIHLQTVGGGGKHSIIVGNPNDTIHKPQMIIGNVTGAKGVGDNLYLDVAGHTFLEGNVAADIDTIRFVSDDKRLYLTGNTTGIQFDADGQLHFLEGDHNIADVVVANNTNAGCIVARGESVADAKANFAAGNENYKIDEIKYKDTLNFTGNVGNIGNGANFEKIDAGEGTVTFTGKGASVNVNKINAKIIKLAGDNATYSIDTIMDKDSEGNVEKVIIAGNINVHDNSTLFGTEADKLVLPLEIDNGGDRKITLGDNVNINVKQNNSELILGSGKHTLVFKGNAKVRSELGTEASPFDEIDITPQAADKAVTFYNNVNTVNGVILEDNGHLAAINVYGNVTGGILAAGDGEGSVTILGSDKTISKIGNAGVGGHKVGLVNFSSDKAKVTDHFAVKTLTFKTNGALTVNATDTKIDTAITAYEDNIGTLIFENGNAIIHAQIGNDNARVKAIQLGENSGSITLSKAVDGHNTQILPRIDAAGDLAFTAATKSPNLDIGSKDKKFALVDLGEDVTFRDAYAANFEFNNKTGTFRSAFGTVNLIAGGVANVTEGGYVKALGDNPAAGIVNIIGSAEIAGAGKAGLELDQLNVTTEGTIARVTTDQIHASVVNHKNATMNATSALKLNGDYSTEDAVLGTKGKFEVTGNVTLADSFTVNDTTSEGVALDLSNATAIDVTGLSGATIHIDVAKGGSVANNRTLIGYNVAYDKDDDANEFKIFLDKTEVTTNSRFYSKLDLKAEGKYAKLSSEFDAGSAVKDVDGLSSSQKSTLSNIFEANKDQELFIRDFETAPDEALTRYASTETPRVAAQSAIELVMSEVADIGSGRINSALIGVPSGAAPKARALSDAGKMQGVAAGDSAERFGLWGSALGGTATQGKRKGSSAFRSNIFGGLVGVDTLLSDRTMAGFVVGNAAGNVKFKDAKLGDRIKSSSWIFSGYGSHSITDNLFVRGAITGSSTRVNSSEKRIGAISGTNYAIGKYTVEAFSAEAAIGYNYRTQGGATFTPSAGIRLSRVNDIEYKETGAGRQNRDVKQNASHSTSILLGAQYSTTQYWDDTVLVPEAHVNVRYGHGVKTPKGKFSPEGRNTFVGYSGEKPSNLHVNFGGGVTTNIDNIEYGVGYDVHLADKYIGHQGTLKVKVKF